MGLFAELKRRNVFRVTFAYIVIAWLVMQVGDTMAPALRLGEWVNSLLAFFLILGLPLAIFFAWVFEVTPEGIKLEKDVDRDTSITPQTGKKVDRLIIGVLVVVRLQGSGGTRPAGDCRKAEGASRSRRLRAQSRRYRAYHGPADRCADRPAPVVGDLRPTADGAEHFCHTG
jgi:hypothetical protein